MEKACLDSVILKRRSVRMYSERAVDLRLLKSIIASSQYAPSACNKQPWRFIVVAEREKVTLLSERALGGVVPNQWARSAPAWIVACAKKSILVHDVAARFKRVPYHYLDMGAVIEHILLKAAECGLGTCWIGWFNKRAVRNILRIPRDIEIVSLITIGYESGNGAKEERTRLALNEIAYLNEYGTPLFDI
jgi:nitroreductase